MIRVLFVCLGNICRSQIAEAIFKYMIEREGLKEGFFVDSAGTGAEVGADMYPNAKAVLQLHNIPLINHKSRQLFESDYGEFDYIICMEEANVIRAKKIFNGDSISKIHKLMDYTETPGDIDDPWYHRDFDRTYKEIYCGCTDFLNEIKKKIQ
ncbi:MAG: low molecular weight phosphotyrosine protein phosphatase [Clostridiales bacterium]|nr:low molecular weight phosphotyrosine protein phosphatase [Clostridiales bacterium]